MDDQMIMMLMMQLAMHYIVLVSAGIRLNRVLTLVVPAGTMQQTIEALRSPITRVFNLRARKTERSRTLNTYHQGLTVIPFTAQRKDAEALQEVLAFFQTSGYGEERTLTVPIILTEETAIEEALNRYFIFLKEPIGAVRLNLPELVLPASELKNALVQTAQLRADMDPMERALRATVCFFPPEYGAHSLDWDRLISRICLEEAECRDHYGLDAVFLKTITQWAADTAFPNLYGLDDAVPERPELDDRIMLYTDSHVFLTDRLLREIAQPILDSGVSHPTLKAALLEAGLLLKNRGGTFTVKVTVTTESAHRVRLTMLKFDRDKLRSTGSLDLIDSCIARNTERNREQAGGD